MNDLVELLNARNKAKADKFLSAAEIQPPQQSKATLAKLDKFKADCELAKLSGEELKDFDAYGNIEVTITRAAEILMVKKSVMARNLDGDFHRAYLNNYEKSGIVSRVYPESRKVQLVRYGGGNDTDGSVINEGVMP